MITASKMVKLSSAYLSTQSDALALVYKGKVDAFLMLVTCHTSLLMLYSKLTSCLQTQGYKEKIVDIREEILRKRRAGKLPGDTTSVLKTWWQTHSKWPYPTVRVGTLIISLF